MSDTTIDLQKDLGLRGGHYKVHDVWKRSDAGFTANGLFAPPPVGVRDSGFYLLTKA